MDWPALQRACMHEFRRWTDLWLRDSRFLRPNVWLFYAPPPAVRLSPAKPTQRRFRVFAKVLIQLCKFESSFGVRLCSSEVIDGTAPVTQRLADLAPNQMYACQVNFAFGCARPTANRLIRSVQGFWQRFGARQRLGCGRQIRRL